MKIALILCIILQTATAWSIPSENVLKSVETVELVGEQLKVSYKLPCTDDNFSQLVFMSDDTGDQSVGVGIVYSLEARNCRADGKLHSFTKFLSKFPNAYAYEALDVK